MTWLLPIRPRVAQCLAYHEITRTETEYLYASSVDKFRRHIQLVRRLNSASSNLDERIEITFDDGHCSQFEKSLPVLESESVKAIFFVTAGWMGARSGYMSWAQLQELSNLGHEVQAHGWSHMLLTNCTDAELSEELKRSKGELESHLGKNVEALSAPGGRWDTRVLDACAEAGFKRIYISNPWIRQQSRDAMDIFGRWMVTRTMDETSVERMLEGKGQRLNHARYLAKEFTKKVVGDRAYQSIWRSMSKKNKSMESVSENANSAHL
jgi:peptidoglycan/xylan/chitin deacetylase (PgdA/CDA1 family)